MQISAAALYCLAKGESGREGGRPIILLSCLGARAPEVLRGRGRGGFGQRAKTRAEASKVQARSGVVGPRPLTLLAVVPAPAIRRLRPLRRSGQVSQRLTKRLAVTAISYGGGSGEAV